MKKALIVCIVGAIILTGVGLFTSTPVYGQDDTSPKITAFTTSVTLVDRAALSNRTARVAVSWTSENRPVFANLVFEQILPDDSTINVELPRIIPWVNSNGDGVAAPILPAGNINEITLRVRLYNLLTGHVYDEREVTIPVGNGGNHQTDPSGKPALVSFTASSSQVLDELLDNKTARIPVSWKASNRPATANLIFEQVLPDGTVVNVELPRENPWVNSEGDGVVAPHKPEEADTIHLRVRFVDLLTGRVYDQRDLTLSIVDASAYDPVIKNFTTTSTSVSQAELQQRTARIPVAWSVENRRDNNNLIFEQVLSDGTVENVELPRDNPWVAAAGNGVVAPYPPGGNATTIHLQVRLVNLDTQATLAKKDITLPISGFQLTEVDPEDCYDSPFIAGIGLKVGSSAQVTATELNVYGHKSGAEKRDVIQAGEQVTVTEGPYCYTIEPTTSNNQNHFRFWRVDVADRDLEGWIQEYTVSLGGQTYHLDVLDASGDDDDDTSDVEIVSFSANVESAQAGEQVILSWQVNNAQSVSLRAALSGPDASNAVVDGLPTTGSSIITVPNYVATGSTGTVYLYAYTEDDTTTAAATETITLALSCPNDFFSGTSTDCVTEDAVTIEGGYQTFEHGFLVWRSDSRHVYTLLNNGTGAVYTESWEGEDITFDETPPEGLLLPQRGFGQVWTTTPALRDSIGWATAIEQSYEATFQKGVVPTSGMNPDNVIYFAIPDGRTVRFVDNGAASTWTFVNES